MREPVCTQQRFVDGLGHCDHTGSGMDSASYSMVELHTITHFICCFCGRVRREEKRIPNMPLEDKTEHGEHNWANAKLQFERMMK